MKGEDAGRQGISGGVFTSSHSAYGVMARLQHLNVEQHVSKVSEVIASASPLGPMGGFRHTTKLPTLEGGCLFAIFLFFWEKMRKSASWTCALFLAQNVKSVLNVANGCEWHHGLHLVGS